eukprot:GILK01017441.1.p1 GENE.GILK01017441.1~~GILK01017441.1.p1  ORF type:complete len:244 (-),score=37.94 GILK01017441.1:338-1069(-)
MATDAKKRAALAALRFVQAGDVVGLGTGSTTKFFIEALGEKVQQGFHCTAVATSEASASLAAAYGIPILDIHSVNRVDVTVDGADEVDPEYNIIKGGGGALFREKLIAKLSSRWVVIVDESKWVAQLGQKMPLPVEVVPFGWSFVQNNINVIAGGPVCTLRTKGQGSTFVTDNGNFILDCDISFLVAGKPSHHSRTSIYQSFHEQLKAMTGVVDTGFFLGMASNVISGDFNGSLRDILVVDSP